jgi:hypothetical protein
MGMKNIAKEQKMKKRFSLILPLAVVCLFALGSCKTDSGDDEKSWTGKDSGGMTFTVWEGGGFHCAIAGKTGMFGTVNGQTVTGNLAEFTKTGDAVVAMTMNGALDNMKISVEAAQGTVTTMNDVPITIIISETAKTIVVNSPGVDEKSLLVNAFMAGTYELQ